jgi:hypothetical protein
VAGLPGTAPATVTATAVARIAAAASISSFTASSGPYNQGQQITLSWDGTATSWVLFDGTTTTNYGPLKTATVRPMAYTTYTLTAKGVGGDVSQALPISVVAQPGTTLVYTTPVVTTQALRIVADPCGACTSITLKLVATAAMPANGLRGVALNVPLDSTKVTLAGFAAPWVTDANPAAKAVIGNGPLKDVLVLGAALKGTGTAPALDAPLAVGAELAHVVLALAQPAVKGVIFDGASLSSNAGFVAQIRSASGATGIAVGKLEVQ